MAEQSKVPKKNLVVGLVSRIDYGSPGYRGKLVREGFRVLGTEETDFNILVGGVISGDDFRKRIKTAVEKMKEKIRLESQKARSKGNKARQPKFDKVAVESLTLDEIVDELSEEIPRQYRTDGKTMVRLYLMTSPAYDGPYGHEVARRLALKRPDIRHWAKPNEHFPLTPPPHPDFKEIACLVPKRRLFRSKYDSAPVDNVTHEYFGLALKKFASVVIVGCFGSSFYKPQGGESPRPIISVPNLSRPEETKAASENQIGVSVIEITADGELFERSHNMNDLVIRERETINISDKYNAKERKVLEMFRFESSWTAGLLSDRLDMPPDELTKILDGIVNAKRLRPPLEKDPASARYYIPIDWIQRNLSYDYPLQSELQEERLIGFGCMHALSINTVHRYIIEELPRQILKLGVNTLVGSGDLIEGREHKLPEQGEVIAGASYDQQETYAAKLIAEAILRVFEVRFAKLISESGKKNFSVDETAELVRKTLLRFVYIPGNHDEWVTKMAFKALAIFRYELLRCLQVGLEKILLEVGMPLPKLTDIIASKVENAIQNDNRTQIGKNMCMSLSHLHMARAQTKTLRSQSILDMSDCALCYHANFHTAISMRRYDPEVGQRVVSQLGTIKTGSGFEDRKGKKVDFGVGYVRLGIKGDRIVMSETAFLGANADMVKEFKSFDNDELISEIAKKSGIRDF